MIVVDASAIVDALAPRAPDPVLSARVRAGSLHAPYLIDIEVTNALRRLVARNLLSVDRAADARDDFAALKVTRYPHLPLLDRVWELRDRLTPYDAAYVALAELIGAPLVTCDAHLARARGHEAVVEIYRP